MKKVVGIFIVATMFASCSEAQVETKEISNGNKVQIAQKEKINKVVSAAEFKKLLTMENIQLIDVRTPGEYEGGHINDAANIDYFSDDFKNQLDKLDRKKPILVYCKSGGRSGKAAQMMKSLNFDEVYDLKGGYSRWPSK